MAWEIQSPKNIDQGVCQWPHGWLEQWGLLWEGMTPNQIRRWLMERESMDPAEAFAYVGRLREDPEAARGIRWADDYEDGS
ncbi:hypothetical protein ASE48_20130 [Mycobacterium sp. Root265]|uniref:hypothetical protein n=1 Tax=Mycobacterium sp. Root265 TaxID=1736504 RepID=UPI000710AC22|nr:hypothetical protein [Mycobacterium sp. Root265]KRD04951.1 hypothetical protein ASE48_20130 [Mycobacterium sp. Root265]